VSLAHRTWRRSSSGRPVRKEGKIGPSPSLNGAHLVGRVDQRLGLGQLDGAGLERRQGALDDQPLILEELEQVVPERMQRQRLGVADQHEAVLSSGQGDVQAPRVAQEADALVLVAAHARHHDQVFFAALNSCGF